MNVIVWRVSEEMEVDKKNKEANGLFNRERTVQIDCTQKSAMATRIQNH